MGRIFEKRKYKMFARFARMAKAFNRVGREIDIAVKAGGPDPKGNARLRIAIQNAKSVNMPKDRVEAAIKRASQKDTTGYQEVVYEGYAPHGIAVVVECATDNPTRTVASIRHIFTKHGGSLAASGAITFMFERKGMFRVPLSAVKDIDEFELEMIDHGLDDLTGDENELHLYTSFVDYGRMQKALEEKGIEVTSSELQYIPTTTKELPEEHAKEVQAVLDLLEEDDDVLSAFHTMA
ncbi:MAG: YebC/PmpR family DNA-binding transcriptional regulator [Bacteroidetes bacterium]|jgi:YebC/PmpR family DNA-binding regulatory protein|nr:YebC/PmpR family DNA-binding transcriptional regulator [Bacteroidota bacterium]